MSELENQPTRDPDTELAIGVVLNNQTIRNALSYVAQIGGTPSEAQEAEATAVALLERVCPDLQEPAFSFEGRLYPGPWSGEQIHRELSAGMAFFHKKNKGKGKQKSFIKGWMARARYDIIYQPENQ